MPKDTFFNLPADKRALIRDVAISEFARYSYDAASINRMVAEAGIAKGSFYQYFEDKRDLFLYLMHPFKGAVYFRHTIRRRKP
jgi:AcrR family transcriptional regulator